MQVEIEEVRATKARDVNNVACDTFVHTCCCGPETLTIVNNDETTVVVEQPLLKIKRVA